MKFLRRNWKIIFISLFAFWLLVYKPFFWIEHPPHVGNRLAWTQFGVGMVILVLSIIAFIQNKKDKNESKL